MNDALGLARGPTWVAAAPASAEGSDAAAPFAHVEVFDELELARGAWAELEEIASVSPYQRYDFLAAWVETIGRANAVAPMIVVARDSCGRVNAVLPFGRRRRGPVWAAAFLGGAHANFKMGLFRPGIAASREAIVDLLSRAARMTRRASTSFGSGTSRSPGPARPIRSPRCRGGRARVSATRARCGETSTSGSRAVTRRRLAARIRKKRNHLSEIGPVASFVARNEPEARAILAAFFRQKDARMRAVGLGNPYEEAETAQFFERAATTKLAQGAQPLELYALTAGERIVATFGGIAHAGRFSGMLISYDAAPEIARCSPGQLLDSRNDPQPLRARLFDLRSRRRRSAVQGFQLRDGRAVVRRGIRRHRARPRCGRRGAGAATNQALDQAQALGASARG